MKRYDRDYLTRHVQGWLFRVSDMLGSISSEVTKSEENDKFWVDTDKIIREIIESIKLQVIKEKIEGEE